MKEPEKHFEHVRGCLCGDPTHLQLVEDPFKPNPVRVYEPTYVDSQAMLGPGTVVWRFANVQMGVTTGTNCSIGGCSEIGPHSRLGDDVRIGFGAFLPAKSIIGSRVFIGPGAMFADDRHPKVNNRAFYHQEPPIVGDDASIGMGALILPGVRIGAGAQIGEGAVVCDDVPAWTVVVGNPARTPLRRRGSPVA